MRAASRNVETTRVFRQAKALESACRLIGDRSRRSALLGGLFVVGALTTQPVENTYECDGNADPVKPMACGFKHVLERPLQRIGDGVEYVLEIHC